MPPAGQLLPSFLQISMLSYFNLNMVLDDAFLLLLLDVRGIDIELHCYRVPKKKPDRMTANPYPDVFSLLRLIWGLFKFEE